MHVCDVRLKMTIQTPAVTEVNLPRLFEEHLVVTLGAAHAVVLKAFADVERPMLRHGKYSSVWVALQTTHRHLFIAVWPLFHVGVLSVGGNGRVAAETGDFVTIRGVLVTLNAAESGVFAAVANWEIGSVVETDSACGWMAAVATRIFVDEVFRDAEVAGEGPIALVSVAVGTLVPCKSLAVGVACAAFERVGRTLDWKKNVRAPGNRCSERGSIRARAAESDCHAQ